MNVKDGRSFIYYPKREDETFDDFVEKNLPKWLGKVAMEYAIRHDIGVEQSVKLLHTYFCVMQDLVYYKHNVQVGSLTIKHGKAQDRYQDTRDFNTYRALLIEENYPARRQELARKLIKKMVKAVQVKPNVKKPPTAAEVERQRKKRLEYQTKYKKKKQKEDKKKYFWKFLKDNI